MHDPSHIALFVSDSAFFCSGFGSMRPELPLGDLCDYYRHVPFVTVQESGRRGGTAYRGAPIPKLAKVER